MHRVLAHEAEEAVLAAHVVRLLEEDTHIVVALLETLGAELATLQRRLFPPAHLARALAAHPPSLCLFPLRCRVTAFFSLFRAQKSQQNGARTTGCSPCCEPDLKMPASHRGSAAGGQDASRGRGLAMKHLVDEAPSTLWRSAQSAGKGLQALAGSVCVIWPLCPSKLTLPVRAAD